MFLENINVLHFELIIKFSIKTDPYLQKLPPGAK
jgi:hypothetical protein